ncbi:MAG: hypothetical protein WAW17_14515, partial [Rhodococcus sp. (in: high G+C Gram-positive bacteria)]|uniref:hypothetical protein n=1 Tax=Rhodococcus sp. TaxID=1831 RepID=UPI003BB1A09F
MDPFIYYPARLRKLCVLDTRRFPRRDDNADVILVPDGWNDYGYTTLYDAYYWPSLTSEAIPLGGVRIAYPGLEPGDRPLEGGYYTKLPDQCFSLGVSADYYIELSRIDPEQRYEILHSLNDIAYSESYLQLALGHEVTEQSLLRSVSYPMITGQFRRIIAGLEVLQEYNFSYFPEPSPLHFTFPLSFNVDPYTKPPTNIHALIGRNGVGKTTLLKRIAQAIVGGDDPSQPSGSLVDL